MLVVSYTSDSGSHTICINGYNDETDILCTPNIARNYQEKRARKSDMMTQTNADAEKVNIAKMTCGSKKLAKKKETWVEMIYREAFRFNDAEIERT